MTHSDSPTENGYPTPEKLEMIWGAGFMSPGGADEVVRIVDSRDLTGLSVLDVGCGLGGAAVTLVQRCNAGAVTGFDVQPLLVDRARDRVQALGLAGRIGFVLGAPGPLPFGDEQFDGVFSKDAIIHVADKAGLYHDIARVLRPGGHVLVGDWLTSDTAGNPALLSRFLALAGHDFHLVSLEQITGFARAAGLVEIETVDRQDWYLTEATAERDRLRADTGKAFAERFGTEAFNEELAFWETLVEAVAEGVVTPGHIRARKP